MEIHYYLFVGVQMYDVRAVRVVIQLINEIWKNSHWDELHVHHIGVNRS